MRTTFHDVVARFGARRVVSRGLFGLASTKYRAPLTFLSSLVAALRFVNECIEAAPARNQDRLTPALVKETTLPRPGTPPSFYDLALTRSVALRSAQGPAVDRSTTRGTVQHDT